MELGTGNRTGQKSESGLDCILHVHKCIQVLCTNVSKKCSFQSHFMQNSFSESQSCLVLPNRTRREKIIHPKIISIIRFISKTQVHTPYSHDKNDIKKINRGINFFLLPRAEGKKRFTKYT
jgi:hypothetical protein